MTPVSLLPKVRSTKIMQSANGKPCALRISSLFPGHKCSPGDCTTVLAHIAVGGKGIGTKTSDIEGAYACFNCHSIIDGVDRKRRDYIEDAYPSALAWRIIQGAAETRARLVEAGIIVVPDAKIV